VKADTRSDASLHVRDVTGKEIENALLRELERQSHVDLLENHMAVDLITAAKLGFAAEDLCLGIYIVDEKSGEVENDPFGSDRPCHWWLWESFISTQPILTSRPEMACNGLARGRDDREHGIRSVSSDLSVSSKQKSFF